MKPIDLLLLSIAIGLTLFTVYVFCAEAPQAEALEPLPEPRNPDFQAIILHHSATHGGSAAAFERNHRARLGGLAYHFVIGNGSGTSDGLVETGYRWQDQIPGPHTKNVDVNRRSVAVCLVGNLDKAPPTRRQISALLPLLERLCRECKIPGERIYSHREVDPQTVCPGRGLPMNRIRSVLAGRLATEPTPVASSR